MRHPPPSHPASAVGADALVATSAVPTGPPQAAMAWAVEHTVAGPRDDGDRAPRTGRSTTTGPFFR